MRVVTKRNVAVVHAKRIKFVDDRITKWGSNERAKKSQPERDVFFDNRMHFVYTLATRNIKNKTKNNSFV